MYGFKISILNALLLCILVAGAVAAAIMLTQLKYVTIIEPPIDDITPEEFYEMYQANPDKYLLFDVRSEGAYNRLHAEMAVSKPLHTMYNERLFLPKNEEQEIVFICSGGVASGVAYHYLEHHGFFNIKRIEGGIEAWELAGLPVASGN